MVTAIADHTGGCLEALALPQTASFTDVGLCYLLERSPELKSLSIASCSSVSDLSIMTLAKCCKRIETLNVSRWVNCIQGAMVVPAWSQRTRRVCAVMSQLRCHITPDRVLTFAVCLFVG